MAGLDLISLKKVQPRAWLLGSNGSEHLLKLYVTVKQVNTTLSIAIKSYINTVFFVGTDTRILLKPKKVDVVSSISTVSL